MSRQELPSGAIIGYTDIDGSMKQIGCSWLVGADGKKGVVQKHFLEPTANIKQETGLCAYTGTWVAANLKIHLPTPERHPELPLWAMGNTPEELYDLFWPAGWHFCSPPGKATANGRFGPTADLLWGKPRWDQSMNATNLLWEHLLPLLTRNEGRGLNFPGDVTYPRDCIDVKRCRPFTFEQKVINRWFHNRTVLIGDAAHVFPPFGGQGIACDIRDAQSLAWHLALMLHMPNSPESLMKNMLTAWASERRQRIDDSTKLTVTNGQLQMSQRRGDLILSGRLRPLSATFPSFHLLIHRGRSIWTTNERLVVSS